MLGGGTGITPLFQALQLLLRKNDTTEVRLLYGNRTEQDILLRTELQGYADSCSRFTYIEVLSRAGADWEGERGRIDEAMIKKHCFPPANDTSVFVCGPPAMYECCCGSRNEKEMKEGTALHTLGYTTDMVFKF